MNPDCIKEVEATLGRALRKGEAETIGERISGNMRELARTDPEWRSKSVNQRLQDAANLAREQDIRKADKQMQRRASNVVAQARNLEALKARAPMMRKLLTGAAAKAPFHAALFERIVQVEGAIKGVRDDVMEPMIDLINLSAGKVAGLFHDPKADHAIVHEVLRGGSDNKALVHAVKGYLDGSEAMRVRANALGMDIGKLDYNYLPTSDDIGKIARAGAETYVNDVIQLVDRSRYLNTDGSPMDEAQLRDALTSIHETKSTDGLNKPVTGSTGCGSRAAQSDNAHRELHITDPDKWIAYNEAYGRGSVLEAIQGHISRMSKNIAMIQEMGANPNATFQLLKQTAEHMDRVRGKRLSGATLDMAWNQLNGTSGTPVDFQLAKFGQEVRSFFTTTRLQGTVLSCIPDTGLWLASTRYNGLPVGKGAVTLAREFMGSKADSMQLKRLGIGIDEVSGVLSRFNLDNLPGGFVTRMANLTLKVGLVQRWDHAMRAGTAAIVSSSLHDLGGRDWDALDPHDRNRMETSGVTAQDWKIWQQAEPTVYKGVNMLAKDGIRAIPDANLDVALADVHAAHLAEAQRQIAALDARNVQDQGWMDARQAAFEAHQTEQLKRRDINNPDQGTIAASVLGAHMADLQAFKERAFDRQEKRQAVMDRLANMGPQMEATRSAAVNSAISHLLGYLDFEANGVVPRPDVVGRAGMTQGTQPGTILGETMRSIMQFKSFAFGIMNKNLQRVRSIPNAKGKLAYGVTLLTALELTGAISRQLKNIALGKDPEDMTTPAFWGEAMLQGGGFGLAGDILHAILGGNARDADIAGLAGPAPGTAIEAVNAARHAVNAVLAGKESPLPGESFKIAKENTPFINLWYAKALLSHMWLDDLQEQIAPGYKERQAAADEKHGTTRFIGTGSDSTVRAPNLGTAIGEH